jgi:hypothetical protein
VTIRLQPGFTLPTTRYGGGVTTQEDHPRATLRIGAALRRDGASGYESQTKDPVGPLPVARWQRLGGGLTTAVLLAGLALAPSLIVIVNDAEDLVTWLMRGCVVAFALVHSLGVVRGTAIGHRTTGYRIMRADGMTPPSYLQALLASAIKIAVGIITIAWYLPVVLALLPLVDRERRQVWDLLTRTRPVSV